MSLYLIESINYFNLFFMVGLTQRAAVLYLWCSPDVETFVIIQNHHKDREHSTLVCFYKRLKLIHIVSYIKSDRRLFLFKYK